MKTIDELRTFCEGYQAGLRDGDCYGAAPMKTIDELRTFCEGYHAGLLDEDCYGADRWFIWGGYDINFAGAMYSGHAKNDTDLRVDAYKAGWTDSIGDPVHSFTLTK